MPKKKIAKKKKVSNANKQRQAVNVKIKIDQSRRTNPREPRQAVRGSLPARGYTANSSTPLHTTIMTATPSPTIIQKEPNYAKEVKRMFEDADFKTNKQLNALASELDRRDEQLLNELARTQLPPTSQLYNSLMNYHQGRLTGGSIVEEIPDEVAYEGVQGFQDPNAKVQTALRTPVKNPEEAKQQVEGTPVAKRTRTAKKIIPMALQPVVKRGRGRPPKLKPVAEVVDFVEQPEPVEDTPKITKYFKTKKQVQEEAEEQRKLDTLAQAQAEQTPKKRKPRKKNKTPKLVLVDD
jgi:hypothetical protein